jgi:hypothetical protein
MLAQRTSIIPDARSSTPTGTRRKAAASPTRPPKRPQTSFVKPEEHSIAETQEGIENDFEFLEGLGEGVY